MAGEDDFDPTATGDAGAASTPAPDTTSTAGNGDTSAGVQPSDDQGKAPLTEEAQRESLIEAVLAKHPPKEDNEEDPVKPKALASETEEQGTKPQGEKPQIEPGKTGAEAPEKPDDKPIPEDAKPNDWLTKEEMAALGPKAKTRIESLWRENREHRSFVEAAEPYLKPLRDNEVPLADVKLVAGLIGALNRGDYKTFYDAAKPYFDVAQQALGIALPEDIQQQVDEGEMTPEVGAALTQARVKAATAEQLARNEAEKREHETLQRGVQQNEAAKADITQAVNDWETTQKARDPDFPRLRPLIIDKMVAFVAQNGPPRNRQDALNLAEYARQEVLKVARPAAPATRQATSRPGVNGAAKTPPKAAPRDVYEHVFTKIGL